ncbi:IS110 family transposase [Streptomyces tsukubensis]
MDRWWAGIDWSWDMQDFVVINQDGTPVVHLRVRETPAGVREILDALRGLNTTSHRYSRRQVPVAIEDGNRLIAAELRRHRQPLIVIPPAVTARYRGRHSAAVSKSDRTDAALLADIIRLNPGRRQTVPETSDHAQAVAVLARAQNHSAHTARISMVRLRAHLGLYHPAAASAWTGMPGGLRRAEARAVLALAPTPALAAALPKRTLYDTLAAAGRIRLIDQEAARLRDLFAAPQIRQRPGTETAMGERTRLHLAELNTACRQAEHLAAETDAAFATHPHYTVYRSFPACGQLVAARLFAEIGDDPDRFTTAKGLRAYAGTAPITWASGSSRSVTHRSVCNRTLRRTAHHWAFGALNLSPGCRALYDARRERGDGYAAALRHVANRLLTGLHHCLLTGQHYDEAAMFRP